MQSPLVLRIGNPDEMDEDPNTYDDMIYGVLDWGNKLGRTVGIAALILGVVLPLLYLVLWALSSCRRRFVTSSMDLDNRAVYMEMAEV